ncbi:MAG: hypothetical protein ACM3PP_10005 [Candidatus Saccharibacteria bacterium]
MIRRFSNGVGIYPVGYAIPLEVSIFSWEAVMYYERLAFWIFLAVLATLVIGGLIFAVMIWRL